jgi:DNA-binding CsgD family transcriptional regulator/sugar-specific transcriptional regulator TrmB
LDGQAVDVYCYAVRRGAVESVDRLAADLDLSMVDATEAIDSLKMFRLLRKDHGTQGRLLPVDPEIAAASLISPMEREIYNRRDLIFKIRERIDTVVTHYRDTRKAVSAPSVVEQVDGLEIRGLLQVTRDECRSEVLIAHPNADSTGLLDDLLPVCLAVLNRGVSVRIICQHGARADLPMRAKLKKFRDAGAAVRTVSCLPRAAVIFDRSSAVLCHPQSGDEVAGARVVHEDVVGFVLDVFNQTWDAATPYDSADECGYCEVADDMQHAIAQLMVQGFTDEVVARRLGMSIRACRRHIAGLLRNLDAVSRFQAGAQAVRKGLI